MATYEDLTVILVNLHFHIKAGELGHVSRGIGVLGSEDGADAEDALAAASDFNLLIELR